MNGPVVSTNFFLPSGDWPQHGIPVSVDEHWKLFWRGVYNWTLQTFIRLKAAGQECGLVDHLPGEGVVLAHRDSLPESFKPGPALLLVCFQGDRLPHPWAQIHIVQNRLLAGRGDSIYMPHWPQPGLVPRSSARGDLFKRIVYYGNSENLAEPLRMEAWARRVETLGLEWVVAGFQDWNDYSNADALVAIRDFTKAVHRYKPPTKLFNAWHAGVPAILGPESAFRAERRSAMDYLEADSADRVFESLCRLKDDLDLRRGMVENGRLRARETDGTVLVRRWVELITGVMLPRLIAWAAKTPLARRRFFAGRHVALVQRRVRSFGRRTIRSFRLPP